MSDEIGILHAGNNSFLPSNSTNKSAFLLVVKDEEDWKKTKTFACSTIGHNANGLEVKGYHINVEKFAKVTATELSVWMDAMRGIAYSSEVRMFIPLHMVKNYRFVNLTVTKK